MISDTDFDWEFLSSKKLEDNSGDVIFTRDTGERHVGSYEIYRGLPFEASANFSTGITDATTVPVFGALRGTGWLEQVLGSESSLWSVHRWGSRIEALTTVIDAQNQFGHSVSYLSVNIDIRYALKQGLWNHDEMHGPLISYQSLNFVAASGAMIGLGYFWNNSLPKVIDQVLNEVRWLRYPKVFELEADYYRLAGSSSTALGLDFNLLANLKMFIRPTVFAQLGLGYRYYDFINQSSNIINQTVITNFSVGGGLQF
jgi:hypothetical protein